MKKRNTVRKLVFLKHLIKESKEEIIRAIALTDGKPITYGLFSEILPILEFIEYFLSKKVIREDKRPFIPFLRKSRYKLSTMPAGRVLIITPYNFPFLLPLSIIIEALFYGNSIVFKPSPDDQQVYKIIKELLSRAGFQIEIVLGDKDTVTDLIKNMKVDYVVFVGGEQNGREVASLAAGYLIPHTIELGDIGTIVIDDSSDVNISSKAAVFGSFLNSGQVCAGIKKIFVHRKIYSLFKEKFIYYISQIRHGDLFDKNTELGILPRDKELHEVVLSYEKYRDRSHLITEFSFENKLVLPIVFETEHFEFPLEEVFGPIVFLTPFDDYETLLTFLNYRRKGLMTYLFGKNVKFLESIAYRLQAPQVIINQVLVGFSEPTAPWGGIGDSGYGKLHNAQGLTLSFDRYIFKTREKMFPGWFPLSGFPLYDVTKSIIDLFYGGKINKRTSSLKELLKNFSHLYPYVSYYANIEVLKRLIF